MTTAFTSNISSEIAKANVNRRGLMVYQQSAHTCYVLLEDGTGINVGPSMYSVAIPQGALWECPTWWKGRVSAIMSGVGGTAMVTEIS